MAAGAAKVPDALLKAVDNDLGGRFRQVPDRFHRRRHGQFVRAGPGSTSGRQAG